MYIKTVFVKREKSGENPTGIVRINEADVTPDDTVLGDGDGDPAQFAPKPEAPKK